MSNQNTKAEKEEKVFESLYSADYEADGVYREIDRKHLVSFSHHPFRVYTETEMALMAASIVQNGVITPVIVRPRKDGTSYEIISGHRRVEACQLLELPTVPCVIKEMNDEDAMLCMIDSNLRQRKNLTASEKAEAYQLKQEALEKKKASGAPMEHGKIRDLIGKEGGDSSSQVQRYLRLNYLSKPLQAKVDNGTISMRAGVELSYLTPEEQDTLRTAVIKEEIAPSEKQAQKLRMLSEKKNCTLQNICAVLTNDEIAVESLVKPEETESSEAPAPSDEHTAEETPAAVAPDEPEEIPQAEKPKASKEEPSVQLPPERTIRLNWSALSPFFSDDMTDAEIEQAILDLLARYSERRHSEKPQLKVL